LRQFGIITWGFIIVPHFCCGFVEMDIEYELIVVGGGITGLVVARNFAEQGVKVLVLEAGSRLGGRIYDIYHTDYFVSTPPLNNHDKSICTVIAAGADRFDANLHDCLMTEIKRYGLQHKHHCDDLKTSYFRSSNLDIKLMATYLQEDLMQENSLDSPKTVGIGATAPSSSSSMLSNKTKKQPPQHSFVSSNYKVDHKSKTTLRQVIDKMNEDASFFDLSTCFDQIDLRDLDCSFTEYIQNHLRLDERDDNDVIQFLKLQIFLLLGAESDDISTLMILQQVKQFGGDAKKMLLFPMNYDYLEEGFGKLIECLAQDILRYPGCAIHMNTSVIAINSVAFQRDIPRVPKYDFPIPSTIAYATRVKLSTGQELRSLGTIVTIPLNAVLSIKFEPSLPNHASRGAERCNGNHNYLKVFSYAEGVTVRISRLFSKWNYTHSCDVQTLAHKLVDGAEDRETTLVNDSEYYDIAKVISAKPGRKKYSIVSLVARREDLLQRRLGSIVQSYKQIHPEISLRLDTPYLTSDDLREMSASQDHQINDSNKVFMKATTGDLSSIFYYDFYRDKMIRSMWFNLRAGTSQLHHLMHSELACPWGPENQSLFITGADMSTHWSGWIEGAVYAAQQATKVMLPFISPPKIERNFAKKVSYF
jgi:hypothetical protein